MEPLGAARGIFINPPPISPSLLSNQSQSLCAKFSCDSLVLVLVLAHLFCSDQELRIEMELTAVATSAAGSAMRGAAASPLQVKPVGKVRSLEHAKAAKERLEKKRAEHESKRAEIETNKKKADEKKKLQEEKNKSSKVEAAPKEGIAPSIQVNGTDGAYQSWPQFQSRLPVPRIYWRAEIAKREEARRAQREWVREIKKSDKLGEIEAVLPSIEVVIVPPTEEIVPAIEVPTLSSPITKEAIVAAHLTSTDGAYQSRPDVEEERSELYKSRPEAHSSLPMMSCSNVKIAKKLVGTKGGLGFWRKQEEARTAHKERMRSEREKKEKKEEEERKKEEEERKKEQEKHKEEERKFMEKMEQLNKHLKSLKKDLHKEIRVARKTVVKKGRKSSQREPRVLSVVTKGALKSGSGRESEPESPNGVLEERTGFGWSESSSSGSSVGFESD